MDTSTYLARLIGPVLAVVGAGILLDPSGYLALATQLMNEPALLYFSAIIGLAAGVALVLAHNVWTSDWRVVLTLLGWISIVDSASWILLAERMRRFWSPLLEGGTVLALVSGVLVLLIGGGLCYFGYFADRRP